MIKPEWVNEFFLLRDELGRWVSECIERYRHQPWRGGHDEGNFMNAMCGYYMLTGDENVRSFLNDRRDRLLDWIRKNYYHGYYRENMDVSHGMENFMGFLTNMLSMDPEDVKSLAAIEDVVHHMGNWVPGVPEWYDWKNHHFRSDYLGTCKIRDYPPYDCYGEHHLWAFETALTAYIMTEDSRYENLLRDWADLWCGIIENNEEYIPLMLYPEKDPEKIKEKYGEVYSQMEYLKSKEFWKDYSILPFSYLLRLGLVCREKRYIECARNILDRLVGWERKFWDLIGDSWLNIWIYKYATGDSHFDRYLEPWANEMSSGNLPTIMMMELEKKTLGWINYWTRVYAYRAADGSVQEGITRPVSLLAAYDISQRPELLSQSMRLARHCMIPARIALRDGSDHGCSTLTYAHGATHDVAYVLWSVAFGRMPFFRLRYYHGSKTVGLPDGIAVCTGIPGKNEQSMVFYNDSGKEEPITVKSTLGGAEETIVLKPGMLTEVGIRTGDTLDGNMQLLSVSLCGG